ncbi:L-type lectin-domain containing receptor kinase VIII.1 [Andrographis paniculata]|uniref:L-type lectin-domain containing receptor kinase VIII.1 n=1 Tax=Andrographis paniculata TaxID=175694 RepID=UPI0021E9A8C7|nr:L-type lectin-domain containing receptor kinase VIII.1 [Andrographis paniculata]
MEFSDRNFCILILILIFSGGNVSAAVKFDFSSVPLSGLKLLGDAHLSNGSVRLTRDLTVPNSGAGKVLYSNPIEFRRPGMESPASFSTFFSFSVSNLNPSSIGGGLAFVISPDDEYVGDGGPYLGITDGKGGAVNGAVAVEFDTLMDVEFKDINGNHVGLDLNSMVSTAVGDLGTIAVDLKSGDSVNSWVEYSGSTRSLRVYVSYSNSKPQDPILSVDFDLADYISNGSMFVGFSGSTQGSTEVHTIQWWSFTSSFDESPAPSPDIANPSPAPEADGTKTASHHKTDGNCRNELCRGSPGAVAGVVTAGAFFLGFCALAFIWIYRKNSKGDMSSNLKLKLNSNTIASDVIKMPKEFSYKALRSATGGFNSDRIIGHGAFGTVYKGIFPATGDVVAVKRCSHSGQGKAEFLSELSIIGALRHRNLVRLQGWCHEKDEILLVYDLMCNGSLDKALFESRIVLPWPHRRKILLGVATALAYLHQECENQVIHRDVKTSNIMLDEGFNARLGDFGLAREVGHDKSPDATAAAGTMGYLAPEYLLTGRASDKTDVFSYGAVVLEVASGRRPIAKESNPSSRVGVSSNLVEWVWGLHREGKLIEAVDPRLENEFDEAEMTRILLVGLACSHPDPTARPTMRRVVRMLEGESQVPIVPRSKPSTSFTTSQLISSLQDSVSDLNGMIGISTTSSETSFGGGHGGGGLDMV